MNEVWPRIYVWPKANRQSFPGKQKAGNKAAKENLTTQRPKITTKMVGEGMKRSFDSRFSFEAAEAQQPRLLGHDFTANRQKREWKKAGIEKWKKTLDKLSWTEPNQTELNWTGAACHSSRCQLASCCTGIFSLSGEVWRESFFGQLHAHVVKDVGRWTKDSDQLKVVLVFFLLSVFSGFFSFTLGLRRSTPLLSIRNLDFSHGRLALQKLIFFLAALMPLTLVVRVCIHVVGVAAAVATAPRIYTQSIWWANCLGCPSLKTNNICITLRVHKWGCLKIN